MTVKVSPYAAAIALVLAAACSDSAFDSDAGSSDDADTTDAPPPDAALPDAFVADAAPPDATPLIYDCEDLPPGPFTLVPLASSITASEDLAFDTEGNLIGANDSTIFKSTYSGERSFFVSLNFRAGMRYSAGGDLMVNDDNNGRLVRIDSVGNKIPVLSGLSYPNGITAGLDGYMYLTEHNARRVRRVHPTTGEFTIIDDGTIDSPNGITFNEDYTALYIGGFNGIGTIYKLPIDAEGNPGTIVPFVTDVGTGWLDGLAVDACGNLYVCDYGASIVYRISPDGGTVTPIIDASGAMTYMPNLQWGSGLGGWDRGKLYIPEGWTHGVFEVDIGVPSKPRVYP